MIINQKVSGRGISIPAYAGIFLGETDMRVGAQGG